VCVLFLCGGCTCGFGFCCNYNPINHRLKTYYFLYLNSGSIAFNNFLLENLSSLIFLNMKSKPSALANSDPLSELGNFPEGEDGEKFHQVVMQTCWKYSFYLLFGNSFKSSHSALKRLRHILLNIPFSWINTCRFRKYSNSKDIKYIWQFLFIDSSYSDVALWNLTAFQHWASCCFQHSDFLFPFSQIKLLLLILLLALWLYYYYHYYYYLNIMLLLHDCDYVPLLWEECVAMILSNIMLLLSCHHSITL